IRSARWEGADAKRMLEEQEEHRQRVRQEREGQTRRDAAIKQVLEESQYEQERRNLEAKAGLSEKERELERSQLEVRHQIEMRKLESEMQQVEFSLSRAAAEHQMTLARIRNDQEGIENAKRKQDDLEIRYQEVSDALKATQGTLEKLITRED